MTLSRVARVAAGAHAAYLVGSGAWPFLHRRSFEAIAGRKEDFWLARTVGGLAIATGASLGLAALRGRKRPESVLLALGSALVLGVADLRAARTESRAYLLDVPVQLAFAPAWLVDWDDAEPAAAGAA